MQTITKFKNIRVRVSLYNENQTCSYNNIAVSLLDNVLNYCNRHRYIPKFYALFNTDEEEILNFKKPYEKNLLINLYSTFSSYHCNEFNQYYDVETLPKYAIRLQNQTDINIAFCNDCLLLILHNLKDNKMLKIFNTQEINYDFLITFKKIQHKNISLHYKHKISN